MGAPNKVPAFGNEYALAEVADMIPTVKKFDNTSILSLTKVGRQKFDVPCGRWIENPEMGLRPNPMIMGEDKSVDMSFEMRWTAADQYEPFHQVERAGEKWVVVSEAKIAWNASGDAWDERTLNLHPAVASLATTDAGFDQAYLTAVTATHQLMAPATRADFSQAAREHIGHMLHQNIQPFRLLMRGACLWFSLHHKTRDETARIPIRGKAQMQDARRLNTSAQFNGHLVNHAAGPHDAVYVRLDEGNPRGVLAAVVAMTASCNPVGEIPEVYHALWPSMVAPCVYFSGDNADPMPRDAVSRESVWMGLAKLAETYDCWDLLGEAFRTVATMLRRPAGMALWMGRNKFVWNLPESNFRAGICGPLFNGVSAQGMKTAPFSEPNCTLLSIEGCIRASFLLSSGFVHLANYTDTHYALRNMKQIDKQMLGSLASPRHGEAFHDMCGSIAKALGWEGAMGRTFRGLRLGDGDKRLAGAFLDSNNYPSVVTLMLWTKNTRCDVLSNAILRPAVADIPDSFKGWLGVERRGIISDSQLASAIVRLPVDLRYRVEFPDGKVTYVAGPRNLNRNRGFPLLSAVLRRGDARITAQIRIEDSTPFLAERTKCRGLNRCYLTLEQDTERDCNRDFWVAEGPVHMDPSTGLSLPAEELDEDESDDEEEKFAEDAAGYGPIFPSSTDLAVGEELLGLTSLQFTRALTPEEKSSGKRPMTERDEQPGVEHLLAVLKSKSPADVVKSMPIESRAAGVAKLATLVHKGSLYTTGVTIGRELEEFAKAYQGLEGVISIRPEMAPEEVKEPERDPVDGETLSGEEGGRLLNAIFLGEGLEEFAAAAVDKELTPEVKAVTWAKKVETSGKDFQKADSGAKTLAGGSGTSIRKTPVASAKKASKATAGTIGFSDPAGLSVSTEKPKIEKTVVPPVSEPTGAEGS